MFAATLSARSATGDRSGSPAVAGNDARAVVDCGGDAANGESVDVGRPDRMSPTTNPEVSRAIAATPRRSFLIGVPSSDVREPADVYRTVTRRVSGSALGMTIVSTPSAMSAVMPSP